MEIKLFAQPHNNCRQVLTMNMTLADVTMPIRAHKKKKHEKTHTVGSDVHFLGLFCGFVICFLILLFSLLLVRAHFCFIAFAICYVWFALGGGAASPQPPPSPRNALFLPLAAPATKTDLFQLLTMLYCTNNLNKICATSSPALLPIASCAVPRLASKMCLSLTTC